MRPRIPRPQYPVRLASGEEVQAPVLRQTNDWEASLRRGFAYLDLREVPVHRALMESVTWELDEPALPSNRLADLLLERSRIEEEMRRRLAAVEGRVREEALRYLEEYRAYIRQRHLQGISHAADRDVLEGRLKEVRTYVDETYERARVEIVLRIAGPLRNTLSLDFPLAHFGWGEEERRAHFQELLRRARRSA